MGKKEEKKNNCPYWYICFRRVFFKLEKLEKYNIESCCVLDNYTDCTKINKLEKDLQHYKNVV